MARTDTEVPLAQGLMQAKRLLGQRQFAAADTLLRSMAAREPRAPEVLALRGMLAAEKGQMQTAVELLTQSLTPEAAPPVFRKSMSVLVAIALSGGEPQLGAMVLANAIPVDDADAKLAPAELAVIIQLANQLAIFRKHAEAVDLLTKYWEQLRSNPRAVELLGELKLALGDYDEALRTLKTAVSIGPVGPGLVIALATAAREAGDKETAIEASKAFLKRFPVFLSPARDSQTMTIGAANWMTGLPHRFTDMAGIHFSGNFLSQIAQRHAATYRVVSVLMNSDNAIKAMEQNPRPDFILNHLSNSELILRYGLVTKLQTLVGIWDRPVINHPKDVLRTTRLDAAGLYSGIANVIVPATLKFKPEPGSEEDVGRVEAAMDYPLIIRAPDTHEGRGAFLVRDRAELSAALQALQSQSYVYLIRFHENRDQRDEYRKLRAAVAGDCIQVVRVDYDAQWNVHGRKAEERVQHYLANPHLLEEEKRVCEDPDAFFGWAITDALRAIRERTPLDVFGIDFDVTADNRLLLFEVNASMNLLTSADPRIPNPPEAEARFMRGFEKLAESLRAA